MAAKSVSGDFHLKARPRRVVERTHSKRIILQVDDSLPDADKESVAPLDPFRFPGIQRVFIDIRFARHLPNARERFVNRNRMDGLESQFARRHHFAIQSYCEVRSHGQSRAQNPAQDAGPQFFVHVPEVRQSDGCPRLRAPVFPEEDTPSRRIPTLNVRQKTLGFVFGDFAQSDLHGTRSVSLAAAHLFEVHGGQKQFAVHAADVREIPSEDVRRQFANSELTDWGTPFVFGSVLFV